MCSDAKYGADQQTIAGGDGRRCRERDRVVEGAVIAEMRRIICTPEVAARVIEEQQRKVRPWTNG